MQRVPRRIGVFAAAALFAGSLAAARRTPSEEPRRVGSVAASSRLSVEGEPAASPPSGERAAPDPELGPDAGRPAGDASGGRADSTRLLERLEAEERARAAQARDEEEERIRRARELEAAQRTQALAAAEAARSFAARRDAMRAWHGSFAEALGPVLAARARLYERLPRRLFAAVRPHCEAVAHAVDGAAERYAPAPVRLVDVLVRDLLAVYRESARHCASGAYFSFTVEERRVRQRVADLYLALEPYGLAFPRAPGSAEASRR